MGAKVGYWCDAHPFTPDVACVIGVVTRLEGRPSGLWLCIGERKANPERHREQVAEDVAEWYAAWRRDRTYAVWRIRQI